MYVMFNCNISYIFLNQISNILQKHFTDVSVTQLEIETAECCFLIRVGPLLCVFTLA